jgi:hypothetical protein
LDLPNLQTVFAAGNSGGITCAPFSLGYRTVYGDYQSAKNVITVGNARPTGVIFSGSSRGPVRDGRIKPEVIAIGTDITSTSFEFVWNFYSNNTGTSMASPAISGGLALLYEKYRLMNAGANPKNGLMKALVCNSGDDWGNPGPDYIHGFGLANFWRAEQMLENSHYFTNSIATGGADQTISISVPSGLATLKVMLYWNDPAAAAVSSQALVNDLDLTVEPPTGPAVLPFILDTAYSQVSNNAHNGVDHINNIEQVVISNPDAGNYTLRVKGTNITQSSPQEYYIVYDYVPTETKLMTPIGSEAYLQGDSVIVQWDSYGDPTNTFKLEFSSDNGSNWSTLNANIPADKRQYYLTSPNEWWVVPEVNTDEARMRISRNGTGFSSTSEKFVIHDTLTVSFSAIQCEGYISIDWNAVPGATGYQVMMLRGKEMAVIASVSNSTLTYTIGGLARDSTYWVTVRPLIAPGGSPGKRAFAIYRKPNNGTCAGTISDNDIKLDSLVTPYFSGRKFTSTSLPNNQVLSVRIKNLDDAVTPGSVTVGYILNGGPAVTETITPNIAGGGTYIHNFSSPVDLSAVGAYSFKFFVNQAGDPQAANDTLYRVIRQLDNPSITGITFPLFFIDNFDAAPEQTFNYKQVGLTELDRYDFTNNDSLGRIRSFMNSGIAYSGNRALTLDMIRYTGAVVTDSLTGTYNLSTFSTALDDIRLDFRYKNHTQLNYPANKVWIRGDDTKPWVLAYDLYANQNPADGSYKFTEGIKLTDLLTTNSQNFSSSFQVRWGQAGALQATGNTGSGYTFDDIRIYKVIDDIKMVSIDTPVVNSCGLSATTPIAITISNTSSHAVAGPIPVRYQINGGGWINENAPGLAANATAQYIFTTTANMNLPGNYLLQVQVLYPSDNYDVNDTLSRLIINNPVFAPTNTSPYLEDFELGNGNWYTSGTNSSWEYGTPASYKINRAASGIKAWKTRLAGTYNDGETSYLYSPCFNITSLTNPTLSFSLALDLEDCGNSLCDGAYIEYSNDGKTWARLGANGQGTNWYNKNYTNNNLWSVQNYNRWHVATISLSVIPIPQAQLTNLRFRFVMRSDPGLNKDGIAFDDFHIYGNQYGIYATAGTSPIVTQPTVNGSGWINFIEGSSSKLIASINPNGTDLGSTDVQSYINSGAVRTNMGQYYHDRNITIKPVTTNLSDSASVRFYFTDAESEALINATGCSYCTQPTMSYELGVTKYTDPNKANEDGTLSNNTTGIYYFIHNSKVRLVPFDVGYYAEFKVKTFSEFWLNNGGLNRNTPLPVKLLSFSAKKQPNNDVLVAWKTTEEFNLSHYEVEVARGNTELQLNRFTSLVRVNSAANNLSIDQDYSFLDRESNKSGVRYYRLKMVDNNGQFSYSSIKPVLFNDDVQWQVYPNPSGGLFYFVYQVPDGQTMQVKLYDMSGKVIRQIMVSATGFLQKQSIDISGKDIPRGLYMMEANSGNKKQFFHLLKQ